MARGHTHPIPTNQVVINLPEGEEVCVVFHFNGRPVAEVAIHDEMSFAETSEGYYRELSFAASPVVVDNDGEAHGLDDFPNAEEWGLRVKEDTVRPEWIYGPAGPGMPD